METKSIIPWIFLLLALIISLILSIFFSIGSPMWTINLMQPLLAILALLAFSKTRKLNTHSITLIGLISIFSLLRILIQEYLGNISTRGILALMAFILLVCFARYAKELVGKAQQLGVALLLSSLGTVLGWILATVAGARWSMNLNNRFETGYWIFSTFLLLGNFAAKTLVLSIGEELFFRRFLLQEMMQKSRSLGSALWLNGLIFGLWHIPVNIYFFHYDAANLIVNTIIQSLNGVAFGAIYVFSGSSILVAGLAHAFADWLVQDLVSPKGTLLVDLHQTGGLFAIGILLGTVFSAFASVALAKRMLKKI